jgi:hypothetical protein
MNIIADVGWNSGVLFHISLNGKQFDATLTFLSVCVFLFSTNIKLSIKCFGKDA